MTSLIDARVADLTGDEFSAMVEAGVFGDRRVFLWNGRVFEKMAKTTVHGFVGFRTAKAITAILPPGWAVWHEEPIRLGATYVPLPDLAVLRGPEDRYRSRHPEPEDVGLIVEVAVTSLAKDLGEQAAEYARAGVASYWVADVPNSRIIAHRDPRVEGEVASSGSVVRRGIGDEIELILDGVGVG